MSLLLHPGARLSKSIYSRSTFTAILFELITSKQCYSKPPLQPLKTIVHGTGGVRTGANYHRRISHSSAQGDSFEPPPPRPAPRYGRLDVVLDDGLVIKLPRMALTAQIVTLPEIPELYDPNFLDVLLPDKDVEISDQATEASSTVVNTPSNPMIGALSKLASETADKTYTAKGAQAFASTGSPTLDAFQLLGSMRDKDDFYGCLERSWAEDPQLTLKIIWNIRSIHDGKGDKDLFYHAFGWLLENHPRTAITNLHLLVSPVCTGGKRVGAEDAEGLSHGYWKDLLNILALVTLDQAGDPSKTPQFLHSEKQKYTYPDRKSKKKAKEGTDPKENIRLSLEKDQEKAAAAAKAREEKNKAAYENLEKKLKDPVYRALYITIARLFSEQLSKDIHTLQELEELKSFDNVGRKPKQHPQLSLIGKWAPTPLCAHDRHTNIATAIALLLRKAQTPAQYPAALGKPDIDPHASASILRSFYQRWVLTPLRKAALVPEPLMTGNKWTEIRYNRVSGRCMQINKGRFFEHDPEGFEKYLTAVESGKKTISGATLWPHELLAEAVTAGSLVDWEMPTRKEGAKVRVADLKKKLAKEMAEPTLRVVEGQWKTLIGRLRESGALENCLAVCDVSGSMGFIQPGFKPPKKLGEVRPIWPAVGLSLILANVAKPPFNGGFITFSATPEYVKLDLEKPLWKLVNETVGAAWGMTTNFHSVFVDLLLPLAVKNNIRKEDMIKRLFVFSDMQFDAADGKATNHFYRQPAPPPQSEVLQAELKNGWETNYDAIEKAYKEAGYDVPELVFWDLANHGTVQVKAERRGVAMMNGLSPAMLKVFMGEEVGEEEEWESVMEDGTSTEKAEKLQDVFNPVNIMKKAVGKKSFDGLVVVD